MKKIMNAIINLLDTRIGREVSEFCRLVGIDWLSRTITWFVYFNVVSWRLWFKEVTFVGRQFVRNADGSIEVHPPYRMTANDLSKCFKLPTATIYDIGLQPGNCMVTGNSKGGIILELEDTYDGDAMTLWHELGHVLNGDYGKIDERCCETEIDADLVAASQLGKDEVIDQLLKFKQLVDHPAWWHWLLVTKDDLKESSIELECRIKTVRNWPQELLNATMWSVDKRVKFVSDEEVA